MKGKRDRGKPYVVFVSYSTMDGWIARRVVEAIRRKKIRTFLDAKDIEGGDTFPESIRDAIRDCDEFIVLLTPHSIDRRWVLLELGAAWGLGKTIVPITAHLGIKEMPDAIQHHKAIDLNNFDVYISQLIKRAKAERRVKR
jgi:TIR domain